LIPSRPLSLVEIVAETFGITRRILLRYWLLFAVLVIPGGVVVTLGVEQLAQDKIASIQHGLHYSDNDLTSLRDEVRSKFHNESPWFALEESALGVQDTSSTNVGNGHISQVRAYFEQNGGDIGAFGVIALGSLLLLVGALALFAATVDLASQVFEERAQETGEAIKAAFRTHFFRMLALHLIYWSVILFVDIVLSVIGGISIAASSVLGSFAMVFELYTSMRLTAAVPSLVSEEMGPIRAMVRSWQLTRGFAARTLALWFAFGLVLFVAALGVSAIGGLLFPGVMEWLQQALSLRPLTFIWLQGSVPGFLWSIAGEMTVFLLLLGAFIPVFATVYYYDLRTRKDGPLVYLEEV
jgi:hypothetical protein